MASKYIDLVKPAAAVRRDRCGIVNLYFNCLIIDYSPAHIEGGDRYETS